MKCWQSALVWLLGAICLALAVTTVLLARSNLQLEAQLQRQRVELERSILGPQKQQLGNNVLQDMVQAAVRNQTLRELLERHGYKLNPAALAAATNAPAAVTNAPPATTTTGGLP